MPGSEIHRLWELASAARKASKARRKAKRALERGKAAPEPAAATQDAEKGPPTTFAKQHAMDEFEQMLKAHAARRHVPAGHDSPESSQPQQHCQAKKRARTTTWSTGGDESSADRGSKR